MTRPWPIAVMAVLCAATSLTALVAFAGAIFSAIKDNVWDILPTAIIVVGVGIVFGFAAYGLWTLKPWGRIMTIVLSVCMTLLWLVAWTIPPKAGPRTGPYSLIVVFVITAIIVGYLSRSSVMLAFSEQNKMQPH